MIWNHAITKRKIIDKSTDYCPQLCRPVLRTRSNAHWMRTINLSRLSGLPNVEPDTRSLMGVIFLGSFLVSLFWNVHIYGIEREPWFFKNITFTGFKARLGATVKCCCHVIEVTGSSFRNILLCRKQGKVAYNWPCGWTLARTRA